MLSLFSCHRFPFDAYNPIGYFVAIVLEYIMFGYSYFASASFLGLAFGLFWISVPMTKEIRCILHKMNDTVQENKNHGIELKILSAEYIDTHGMVKQLSINSFIHSGVHSKLESIKIALIVDNMLLFIHRVTHDLSDIFQPMFMLCYTWSLLAISAALLVIQVEVVEYIYFHKRMIYARSYGIFNCIG